MPTCPAVIDALNLTCPHLGRLHPLYCQYSTCADNANAISFIERVNAENITCAEFADWTAALTSLLPSISWWFTTITSMLSSIAGIFGYLPMLFVFYRSPRDFGSPSYAYHKAIAWLELVYHISNIYHRIINYLLRFGVVSLVQERDTIFIRYYRLYLSILMRNTISKAIDFVTLGVTLDRFIAVCFPTHWGGQNTGTSASRMQTIGDSSGFNQHSTAYTIISASAFLAILVDIPDLFAMRYPVDGGSITKTALVTSEYYWYLRCIKLGFCSVLLPLTISVLTVFIIRGFLRLRAARERRGQTYQMYTSSQQTAPKKSSAGANITARPQCSQFTRIQGQQKPPTSCSSPTFSRRSPSTATNNYNESPLRRSNEWRNLTNLCYLLLALVVPFVINHVLHTVYTVDVFNRVKWVAHWRDGGCRVRELFTDKIAQRWRQSVVHVALEITNDFYHASNFYLYLWLSAKFRGSFLRDARRLSNRLTRRQRRQSVGGVAAAVANRRRLTAAEEDTIRHLSCDNSAVRL